MTSARSPRKRTVIAGQFVAHPRQLLESAAMRVLTLAERRALDRFEIEHMGHAGSENGKLIVTYANLVQWGIRRDSIAGAIRALEALGLIEITRRGYGGAAEVRVPSLYRLTYLPAWNAGRADSTGSHEYQHIKTVEEAEEIATKARRAADPRNTARAKIQNATPQIVQNSPPKMGGETQDSRPTN